jgi:hypothetical protein
VVRAESTALAYPTGQARNNTAGVSSMRAEFLEFQRAP